MALESIMETVVISLSVFLMLRFALSSYLAPHICLLQSGVVIIVHDLGSALWRLLHCALCCWPGDRGKETHTHLITSLWWKSPVQMQFNQIIWVAQSKWECGCGHLVLATHRHGNTLTFLPPHTLLNDSVQLFHLIVVYTAWERMSGIYWFPVFYFPNE